MYLVPKAETELMPGILTSQHHTTRKIFLIGRQGRRKRRRRRYTKEYTYININTQL